MSDQANIDMVEEVFRLTNIEYTMNSIFLYKFIEITSDGKVICKLTLLHHDLSNFATGRFSDNLKYYYGHYKREKYHFFQIVSYKDGISYLKRTEFKLPLTMYPGCLSKALSPDLMFSFEATKEKGGSIKDVITRVDLATIPATLTKNY